MLEKELEKQFALRTHKAIYFISKGRVFVDMVYGGYKIKGDIKGIGFIRELTAGKNKDEILKYFGWTQPDVAYTVFRWLMGAHDKNMDKQIKVMLEKL